RVSVLFCCNMDGTEKTNLLLIGKAKRPMCLRKVHVPVDWASNKSAWMTRDIFNKWLLDFDGRLKKEKRKVLLFLDNCSSHMQVPELQSTKVVYFPPCTTLKLQPIDQGIVHSVKSRYRMRLAERLLYNMQRNIDSVIDLKFAVQVVSAVWEQVEARVIKNCFRKAGFVFNDSEEPVPLVDNPDEPEPGFWEAVEKAFGSEDFSDYVNIDADVVRTEQLTDEEIV
ncbi:transposase, putative, partial [Ixodes scapularis]